MVFPSPVIAIALGLGALGVGFARAEPPEPTEPRQELLQSAAATDIQRTAALVAGDTRILERIFADELSYGHSDGRLDTKDELLAALTERRLRFHAVNPGPRTVQLIGDNVALVAARADLLVGPAEAPVSLSIRYLAVYRLDPRVGGWRLTAYQAAPVARAG